MVEVIIGFVVYIVLWSLIKLLFWFLKRPKIITKDMFIDNYKKSQEVHKDKFKKSINNDLRIYLEEEKDLPLTFTYHKVFDELSLADLEKYIRDVLKFKSFELEQTDMCRLILKK